MRPGDPMEVTGNTPPTIDRYTIEAPIGRGGFGNVFRARHMHTKQLVALKVLRSSAIRSGHTAAHLVREAQIVASVRHRNIVQVMDAGIVDDAAFVAMELVEGPTLAERIDTAGPLPIGLVLDLAHQLLGGLEAAHRAGVVHRDIKPQNLVVLADGTLKILDFGISKASFVAVSATSEERWAGTPGYMAPEQYGSGDVDARADIYAAGATLFRMICGRRPFSEDHFATLMTRVLSERAPLVSAFRPDAPAGLVLAVDRALARDRDARFPSAAAFAAALGPLAVTTPHRAALGEAPTLLAAGDATTTLGSPAPPAGDHVHPTP
ncbi:MAG: serine/threonine protein kinase, partial [Polyangiaceae bacterium]|nr:serine/threonine protein kinase [Polyangiaceae bacterium]